MQRDQTGENSGEPQENPESEREATEDDGYVSYCMVYGLLAYYWTIFSIHCPNSSEANSKTNHEKG